MGKKYVIDKAICGGIAVTGYALSALSVLTAMDAYIEGSELMTAASSGVAAVGLVLGMFASKEYFDIKPNKGYNLDTDGEMTHGSGAVGEMVKESEKSLDDMELK